MWWIWASQVAYNVRFNNDDWLRRLFVCLQLIVFGALAAFTNDFDVFNGIQGNGDQGLLNELQRDEFASGANIAAGNERQQRLPILNSRGICIVMALSRLLLLAQYLTCKWTCLEENSPLSSPFCSRLADYIFLTSTLQDLQAGRWCEEARLESSTEGHHHARHHSPIIRCLLLHLVRGDQQGDAYRRRQRCEVVLVVLSPARRSCNTLLAGLLA